MSKRKKLIVLTLFLCLLVFGGLEVYILTKSQAENEKKQDENIIPNIKDEDAKTIGGDKDEHGCLIAAGYSWCVMKQKCLRIWEEPCTEEDTLRNYLKENISQLSPEKEVLGGKFFITKVKLITPGQAEVEYEDGHIALKASVRYSIGSDEQIKVEKFEIMKDDSSSGKELPEIHDAIKALFVDKYKKDISTVNVSLLQQDDGHARGSVRFEPEGEGGLFLAAVIDGKWQLVYDGNGSIDCQEMSKLGFDEAMLVNICY